MERKLAHKSKFENNYVNTFIMIAVVIATLILLLTFVYFFVSQVFLMKGIDDAIKLFQEMLPNNANSQAINAMANPVPPTYADADELLTLRMQYLERLSVMHSQATSRDLFVFIYGFLSSVLIVVSANSAKKGETKLKEISDLVKDGKSQFEEISDDLSKKHDELKEIAGDIDTHKISLEQLYEKCATLDEKHNTQVAFQENSIRFNFISQILLEALTSVFSYNTALKNEDLVQFKQSIRQASNLCDDIVFSNVDHSILYRFEQRLGYIIELYNEAAEKPGTEITPLHKKYIYEDFTKIKNKLKA